MKNQLVMRKVRVIWVDLNSGMSERERKMVAIMAAILMTGLIGMAAWWILMGVQ